MKQLKDVMQFLIDSQRILLLLLLMEAIGRLSLRNIFQLCNQPQSIVTLVGNHPHTGESRMNGISMEQSGFIRWCKGNACGICSSASTAYKMIQELKIVSWNIIINQQIQKTTQNQIMIVQIIGICIIINRTTIMNQIRTQDEDEMIHINHEGNAEEDRNKDIKAVKRQAKNSYIAVGVFAIVISIVLIFKVYKDGKYVKSGKFYEEQLMKLELDDFWKLNTQQLKDEQLNKKIIKKGPHQITREQLGKNSWGLLHMITGSFPQNISDNLVSKFNIFLILFAQMYPCKLCANHFMALLNKEGLFKGTTKVQLMTYLCDLHNKVNQRLQKPQHPCKNVVEQWNTCGCNDEAL